MMSSVITSFLTSLLIIISMSFFTLMERKMLGYIQLRKGPNKISMGGALQPFSDAMKLLTKETSALSSSSTTLFYISPPLGLYLALLMWTMHPGPDSNDNITFSMFFFLCLSSVSVYVIIFAGWSSNAKYSLLGTLRTIAQTISYEITMAVALIGFLVLTFSFNSVTLANSSLVNLLFMVIPLAFIWFASTLAETNRSPFDFAEGESELVSGFNTEYGGPDFAFIFMAEYLNILFISLLSALLLTQATPYWPMFMTLKMILLASMSIVARATLPRLRYDQLMMISWASFLPASLLLLVLLISV